MIFVRILNEDTIKRSIIQSYNFLNNSSVDINLSGLSIVPSVTEGQNLLIDSVTKVGLLFNKTNLNELIDKEMDISIFEDTTKFNMQLKEPSVSELEAYNLKVDERILSSYENNFSMLSNYSMDTLKKYATFCRVAGFYSLDIGDVILQTQENKLIIQVVDNHPVYFGTLEIKTW